MAATGSNEEPSQARSLSSLPIEILEMIICHFDGNSEALANLGLTCHKLHILTVPLFCKRFWVGDAEATHHWKEILLFLKSCLTISQRDQLEREGVEFEGQGTNFPTSLGEESKPNFVQHVRHVIINKLEDPTCQRYIVEALGNMKNLEILETEFLSRSMAEQLPKMKNLKAFFLSSGRFVEGDCEPLANVTNLEHLHWQSINMQGPLAYTLQSMLRNSSSTLQTLELSSDYLHSRFFEGWETSISDDQELAARKHTLTSLQSLALSTMEIDESFMMSLQKAVNLIGLRRLEVRGALNEGLFYTGLSQLTTSVVMNNQYIHLQEVALDMKGASSWAENRLEDCQNRIKAKLEFLSSISTLKTLHLHYCDGMPTMFNEDNDRGLWDQLVRAILNHGGLRTLKMNFIGWNSNVPGLPVGTVKALVGGLPYLEEFHFTPEEARRVDTGVALSRGSNLKFIRCYVDSNHNVNQGEPGERKENLIRGLLDGYLSSCADEDAGRFTWEERFKVKTIWTGDLFPWLIASDLGPSKEGWRDQVRVQGSRGNCHVSYRGIIHPRRNAHRRFMLNRFKWGRKVVGEI